VTERLFPAPLELTGDQAVFGLDGFVLSGRPLGIVARSLKPLVQMGLSALACSASRVGDHAVVRHALLDRCTPLPAEVRWKAMGDQHVAGLRGVAGPSSTASPRLLRAWLNLAMPPAIGARIDRVWLSLAYSYVVRPHESLRQPLEAPEPTRGQGSPRRWKPVTPAMAAGITEHIWTTQEFLSYRVPVSFLDRLQALEHLYQPIKDAHQGS